MNGNAGSAAESPPYILLTGATGYVGKHVLKYLLKEGWQVGVLVRPNHQSSIQRIHNALSPLGQYDISRVEVFEGDFLDTDAGLSPDDVENLQGKTIHALIHCAAVKHSELGRYQDAQSSNLQCLAHVYSLCSTLQVKNFLYMSSAAAYDAGVGGIPNPYERIKQAAESYLQRQSDCAQAPNIRIYRPSIVVGGHPASPDEKVTSIYAILKTMRHMRESCIRGQGQGNGRYTGVVEQEDTGTTYMPIRVAANAELRINLVSIFQIVDAVIADIYRAIGGELARYSGKHLLGQDFLLQDVQKLFCDILGITGTEFVTEESFDTRPGTTLEKLFSRSTYRIRPYLLSSPAYPERDKNYVYRVNLKSIAQQYCSTLDKGENSRKGFHH